MKEIDLEKIRSKYEEAVRRLVSNYLLEQKNEGRTIAEVDPWQKLEENRFLLATEITERTNYPVTLEGSTSALLIIEGELRNVYGEEQYLSYIRENQEEWKVDYILEKDAKRVAEDLSRSLGPDSVPTESIHKIQNIWLRIISEYKPYLALKLQRTEDGKVAVIKRSLENLGEYMNQALSMHLTVKSSDADIQKIKKALEKEPFVFFHYRPWTSGVARKVFSRVIKFEPPTGYYDFALFDSGVGYRSYGTQIWFYVVPEKDVQNLKSFIEKEGFFLLPDELELYDTKSVLELDSITLTVRKDYGRIREKTVKYSPYPLRREGKGEIASEPELLDRFHKIYDRTVATLRNEVPCLKINHLFFEEKYKSKTKKFPVPFRKIGRRVSFSEVLEKYLESEREREESERETEKERKDRTASFRLTEDKLHEILQKNFLKAREERKNKNKVE